MKKQILGICALLLVLFACDKDPKVQPEKTDGTFKRTVLLYIIGASNLSNQVSTNINGIVTNLQNDADLYNNNFLIYVDDYSSNNHLIDIRRNHEGKIYRDTVATFPDRNSASMEVLNSIIKQVAEEYHSEKYGLVLWGHGTGWLPTSWVPTRSYGGDRGEYIELKDLEQAIPANMFDYILFDACFMASCETIYELKNKADYMIASAAEIMGSGFPYAKMTSFLLPETPPYETICKTFYEHYEAQSGTSQTATISLIDMKKMDALASATKSILNKYQTEASELDLSTVQRFDRSSTRNVVYDLDDYVNKITEGNADYTGFQQVLKQVVLYKANTDYILGGPFAGYRGPEIKVHGGITTYPYYSLHLNSNEEYLHEHFKETNWYKAVYQ